MIIYDTLDRTKKELIPLRDNRINIFVCGPTVYDYSHIGHARTYVFFDMFVSYLRYLGYDVFYLQNITDIDDKIIKKANETNMKPEDIAMKFYSEYIRDMLSLKVDSINIYAPATHYVDEIIDQIKRLINLGYAYETDDGVYFEVSKFKDYGKLSHQNLDEIIAGYRVDINEKKKNPIDFALWKKKKEGEPYWPSPFGEGRPGWHIEDTAITEHYFGPQYDIHGGGSDLIFPHHECEIAQMEAVSNVKPMVRYWMHTGLLTIKSERMGKSMGNVIRIRDVLERYSAEVIRFFLLSSHYRSPIDFSYENLEKSRETLERIIILYRKLKNKRVFGKENKILDDIKIEWQQFIKDMDDDVNTPGAISHLMKIVNMANKYYSEITEVETKEIIRIIEDVNRFFKFLPEITETEEKLMAFLLNLREEMRKNKQYEMADKIRNNLKELNLYIEDSIEGPIWYRI
ncbi:MAG: cysteine--tRNA ligase [Thermoplasmata archaeon]